MKRRVHITIERDVAREARRVAREARRVAAERGTSLWALVEGELKRLIASSPELRGPGHVPGEPAEHWLEIFHRTYLSQGRRAGRGVKRGKR